MIVWRVSSVDRTSMALSGEGAFRYPGRWNLFGTPMVYASESPSLAVLEYAAHVPRKVKRPVQLVLLKIEIPNSSVDALLNVDLPADWDAIPSSVSTQKLGTDWAQNRKTLALAVPTAILPLAADQKNVLLNPLHPHFAKVRVLEELSYHLDERILDGPRAS